MLTLQSGYRTLSLLAGIGREGFWFGGHLLMPAPGWGPIVPTPIGGWGRCSPLAGYRTPPPVGGGMPGGRCCGPPGPLLPLFPRNIGGGGLFWGPPFPPPWPPGGAGGAAWRAARTISLLTSLEIKKNSERQFSSTTTVEVINLTESCVFRSTVELGLQGRLC